jgi:hypothetical protein
MTVTLPLRLCAKPCTSCTKQDGSGAYAIRGTRALVETLLERGAEGDPAEAREAFD